MISPDQEAKILRFYHAEKWPIATIARQFAQRQLVLCTDDNYSCAT